MDREYLIKKWLADELTPEELQAFKELDDYDSHVRVMKGAKSFKASDHTTIPAADVFLSKAKSEKRKRKFKNFRYDRVLNIAAVLALFIGIGSVFFLSRSNTVETEIGEKENIELPDGSSIMLNSGSSVTYKPGKWSAERMVELEGEAFFKVGKGKRFDVVTPSGIVTVLGTEFNIKNREGYLEVTCYKGLIRLKSGDLDLNIRAGSTFTMIKGKTKFEEIEEVSPDWTNNISVFDSVTFEEVLKEFERQYEVTFSLENVDVNRIFTGGFVHNDLEDGLKSITLPLDLIYSIDKKGTITLKTAKE
ncbi:FecR family protein [Aquimarina spongiae]|uniref:FecR family protein n=1 Tax=Aquimarina spongiae TaxID=570521 RepID=A0A1M6K5L5_9FLAO|nr:FecR family protein [Aquimarina spongiae]SHJ54189.1 FecR family protein [Aquimarina spongiae]